MEGASTGLVCLPKIPSEVQAGDGECDGAVVQRDVKEVPRISVLNI